MSPTFRTEGGGARKAQPFDTPDELNSQVLEMGTRALKLLRYFGLNQISEDELVTRLPELRARTMLLENWDLLASQHDYGPCLEVLLILSSLESEADHQIRTYGADSLHEDYGELQRAVARLQRSLSA